MPLVTYLVRVAALLPDIWEQLRQEIAARKKAKVQAAGGPRDAEAHALAHLALITPLLQKSASKAVKAITQDGAELARLLAALVEGGFGTVQGFAALTKADLAAITFLSPKAHAPLVELLLAANADPQVAATAGVFKKRTPLDMLSAHDEGSEVRLALPLPARSRRAAASTRRSWSCSAAISAKGAPPSTRRWWRAPRWLSQCSCSLYQTPRALQS